MKPIQRHPCIRRSIGAATTTATLLAGLLALPATADEEMEYERSEGLHEEEWYDPGDWFNEDDQVSYESDLGATGWNDSNWSDSFWTGHYVDPYTPVVYTYYTWNPATADWSEDSSSGSSQTAGNAADRKRAKQQRSSFSGRIDGFRSIDLTDQEGVREKHSFVKVTLKDGSSRVLSLGGKTDKGDLSLSTGDEIRATGKVVKVDGRKVLLAKTIQSGGESFTIRDKRQPELSSTGEWKKKSAERNRVTRKGTLEDHTTVDLDGKRSQNLIVRLEMKDGRSCVVDLGAGTTLDELGLSAGDKIVIKGHRTRVDGKNLLVANRLRVEGEQQRIRDRSRGGEYRSDPAKPDKRDKEADSSQASAGMP